VHTLRADLSGVASLQALHKALRTACDASGAPELQRMNVRQASIQYLDVRSKPQSIEGRLRPADAAALRDAKALRVVAQVEPSAFDVAAGLSEPIMPRARPSLRMEL
jgi:hypothetical protein